jgi:hypothetical protein
VDQPHGVYALRPDLAPQRALGGCGAGALQVVGRLKTRAQLADPLHDFPWMRDALLEPVDWAALEREPLSEESDDRLRALLYATLPRLWSAYDALDGLAMVVGVEVDSLWVAWDLERYSLNLGATSWQDLDPADVSEALHRIVPLGYAWEAVLECPARVLTVRWNGEVERSTAAC